MSWSSRQGKANDMANTTNLPEELVLRPPEPMQHTPMDLLSVALKNNAAIDVIERLAALQEKARARDDEIDFNEAMNRIQEQIKRIAPDLTNPQTSSRYASYPKIDRVIRPIYAAASMSLSFTTEDCPLAEHVRVVCFVALRGHTRKYQIDMPCDGKGAKGGDVMTKTHATGAAVQYGMRYLVKGIFNIAIGSEDTDGNEATNGELAERLEAIADAGDVEVLATVYKAAFKQFATKPEALKALIAAKDARKKELTDASH